MIGAACSISGWGPKMQVVPLGSTLTLTNFDDDAHTVHAFLDRKTLFNLATVPDAGTASQRLVLDTRGVIDVVCDIHPEMRATLVVARTPHFAVTDEDGRFCIAEVPPGHYNVRIVSARTAAVSAPADEEPGDVATELTVRRGRAIDVNDMVPCIPLIEWLTSNA